MKKMTFNMRTFVFSLFYFLVLTLSAAENHTQPKKSPCKTDQSKSKRPHGAIIKKANSFRIKKSFIEKHAVTPAHLLLNKTMQKENAKQSSNQHSVQDPSFHKSFQSYSGSNKQPTISDFKNIQPQQRYTMEGRKIYSAHKSTGFKVHYR